jgi:hypothetical protein
MIRMPPRLAQIFQSLVRKGFADFYYPDFMIAEFQMAAGQRDLRHDFPELGIVAETRLRVVGKQLLAGGRLLGPIILR